MAQRDIALAVQRDRPITQMDSDMATGLLDILAPVPGRFQTNEFCVRNH